MNKRKLGKSNVEVSPLGMGCWAIGGLWQFLDGPGGWGEVDDDESVQAIHAALEHGINFFDTAANYGAGHSEEVLARALVGRRDEAIIATKFGWDMNEAAKQVKPHPDPDTIIANVRAECDDSLRRLNTNYIDLYQLHVWDFPVARVPELLEVLDSLVEAGKIRAYGWSTDSAEAMPAFAKGAHCVAVQHDLNVVKDAPEMLALCEQLNLASINRSPLARGALTGKYSKETTFAGDDVRKDQWSWETFFVPALDQLNAIRDILTSEGRSLTQGALAWIWGRSEKTIPIPGIRTVAQATENAKAMEYGPLSAAQMAEIESILHRAPEASDEK